LRQRKWRIFIAEKEANFIDARAIWNMVQGVMGIIGGWLGWFLGGYDGL